MSPTRQLHRDVSRRLRSLKRGPGWLAKELGVNRITLHHFLRRRTACGEIRQIQYETGVLLRDWYNKHKTK